MPLACSLAASLSPLLSPTEGLIQLAAHPGCSSDCTSRYQAQTQLHRCRNSGQRRTSARRRGGLRDTSRGSRAPWRERDAASTRWPAQSSPQRWPLCALSTAAAAAESSEHPPAVRKCCSRRATWLRDRAHRESSLPTAYHGAHAARGNRRRAVLVRVLPACGRQPAARASRQREQRKEGARAEPAAADAASGGRPSARTAPAAQRWLPALAPRSAPLTLNPQPRLLAALPLAARNAPTHVSASCSSASPAEPPPHLSDSPVSHSQLAPPAPYQRAPPPPRESPTAASPRARRSSPSMRCVPVAPLALSSSSSLHAAQLAQAPHRDGHDEAVRARVCCGAHVERCPLTSLCAQPHVRPRSHARQRLDAGVLCALPRARGE
jgi:hypothetical protein